MNTNRVQFSNSLPPITIQHPHHHHSHNSNSNNMGNSNNNNNNNHFSPAASSSSVPTNLTPTTMTNNSNSNNNNSNNSHSATTTTTTTTPPTTPTSIHKVINTTPTNPQQQTLQQQQILNMCNSGKYRPSAAVLPHIHSLLSNFQDALKRKSQGQPELYDKMTNNFSKLPPNQLVLAFKALSLCAGLLNMEHHASFIGILVNQKEDTVYFQRDADVIHSYIDLMSSLFSYCPNQMRPFLTSCVHMLKPMDMIRFQRFNQMLLNNNQQQQQQSTNMNATSTSTTSTTTTTTSSSSHHQVLKPQVLQELEEAKFRNVLAMLQHLSVKHAQSFQKLIIPILSVEYPHQSSPLRDHKYYVSNLLQVAQYLPDRFFTQIFRLIIDKLIIMDAEIKPGLEDPNETATATVTTTATNTMNHGVTTTNVNHHHHHHSQTNNAGSCLASAAAASSSSIHPFDLDLDASVCDPNVDELVQQVYMAEKLDTVMLILFGYIETCSKDSVKIQRIFDTMMQMFSSFVANTYQLHSIQFLMFYICSFNIKFVQRFNQYLLNKVLDKSQNVDVRKCCAAYISGFVSRANYMTCDSVVESLEKQIVWLEQYIQTFEKTVTPAYLDIGTHTIFYSVCQGVFYVLCYKIHQLINHEQGRLFLHKPVFEKIIYSRFNPFKIIAIDVVQEVVQAFKLYSLHDFSQLVINNRDLIVVKSKSTINYLENNFFPFDPYLLRQSQLFITPLYQKWEGGYDLSYHNMYNNPPVRGRSRSIRSTASVSSDDMYDDEDDMMGGGAFSYEEHLVGSNHYQSMERAGLFFQASESSAASTRKSRLSMTTTTTKKLKSKLMMDDSDSDISDNESDGDDDEELNHATPRAARSRSLLKHDDDDDDVNFDDDDEEDEEDDDDDDDDEQLDDDSFSSDEGEHYHPNEDEDIEIGSYGSSRYIMIPGMSKSHSKNSSAMRGGSYMAGSPASFDEMQHPYGWPNM